MTRFSASLARLCVLAAPAGALLLASCASVPSVSNTPSEKTAQTVAAAAPRPSAGAGAAPAMPGTTPAAAMPAAAPTPLRPFAEIIREAKETKGLFTAWQKDERVWLEIKPDQLEQEFLLTTVLSRGVAQLPFVPGLLGDENVVLWRRIGNQVQLVARNTLFRAPLNSPISRALRDSVSDSLLASVAVVSAPHPERKSFLIDATPLLLSDVAGLATIVDAAFRTGYALDVRNSAVERVRATDAQTTVAVNLHYAVPKIPIPPPVVPPGTPLPTPPRNVPDARSFFLGLQYRFAALPTPPMPIRIADERVGYFVTEYRDLAQEPSRDARVRVARRWRLEKQDPAAAMSEPKQAIVAMLDRNIPADLRPAVQAGVLAWNAAFEQAGFKNAIVVQQQADDAEADTFEGRHIAVKWFVDGNVGGSSAIGPSQTDLRTGEILHASVLIPEAWARFSGQRFSEVVPPRAQATSLTELLGRDACTYADEALEYSAFSFELLVSRGAFERDSAPAREFIAAAIQEVVMHEMGHALGLRHNFKASSSVKLEQLRDAAYTRANGLAASVMDYLPDNLPLANETPAQFHMSNVGAYDRWAIEWGYSAFESSKEVASLAAIANRSATDPALAYATDEDAGSDGDISAFAPGVDPLVNRFDFSSDPIAYYQRQFQFARELWQRTQTRRLDADDDYQVYRRNLQRGMGTIRRSAPNLAKFVGGVYVNRDRAGSGRPLLVPVEPAKQRTALRTLTQEVFAASSFRFDPQFMQRLGVDQFARSGAADFSLPSAVLEVQRAVLDQLMSEGVAVRLANSEAKLTDARTNLSFAEVQTQLAAAVWSELRGRSLRDIDSQRRSLQREHIKRVAATLLRPAPASPTDLRAVMRQVAVKLEADLTRKLKANTLSDTTRAHLAEHQATLSEALKAPLVKQGV